MKKIVHIVIGKANPESSNGVNKAVHGIAARMAAEGRDVEVWGLTETPEEQTVKRPYSLHLFQAKGRSFFISPLVIEAIDALPAGSLVHFHGGLIPAYYGIAKYLKRKNIPWVISPHAAYMRPSMRRKGGLKALYLKICEKFMLRHARAVHVLTDLEATDTKAVYADAPLVTIPNAYADEDVKRTSFSDIYAHAKPVFCYIGRLDKVHKGLDLLIEGFSQYTAAGGQGELWLVGEGPHEAQLRHLAANRYLGNHVRFWGSLYGREKLNVLLNAQVFVHTSRWEGMPMSLLEAAAHARPLLISKGTGLSAEVDKWRAGIVLNENSPAEIAQAMFQCQQLQKLGKLQEMGRQAAQMVDDAFRWDKVIRMMNETLYRAA